MTNEIIRNILPPCHWMTVNIEFYRRDFEKPFRYNYYQGEIFGKQFSFVTLCSQGSDYQLVISQKNQISRKSEDVSLDLLQHELFGR